MLFEQLIRETLEIHGFRIESAKIALSCRINRIIKRERCAIRFHPVRYFGRFRYRASGLNLVVAAIILWNPVYLEKALQALRDHGQKVDDSLLKNLSPLGWEHINLTGDYIWKQGKKAERSKFKPLRPIQNP
jgi:hypothetical protein